MRQGDGAKGVVKERDISLEILSGYDLEEDIAVGVYDINMDLAGNIDGNAAWSRLDYSLLGLHNFGAADAVVLYRIYGTNIKHSVRISSGGSKDFKIPIRHLLGSGEGTTVGATIKLLYKDKAVVNSNGPRDIA